MRKACLNAIYELAKKDERVVFIGSDLGNGTLDNFKNEMPDRFFMEGISEANIIGMATGLALDGKIVYINTIATFLTRRAYEQIVVDLCLHKANVRLVGNGGGLVYGPLGPTHQAIEDIAITRVIPNMTVIVPADSNEMTRIIPQTLDYNGPIYIRLAKGNDPVVTGHIKSFDIGRAYPIITGKDASIFTTGVMLQEALEAARLLSEQNIQVSVIHVPTIKPLDINTIKDYLTNVPLVLSVEEHLRTGGLGSAIAEIIAEQPNIGVERFKVIGIPDQFTNQCGSQNELMHAYAIDRENIIASIKQMLMHQ